jgi:hypothetical protein
MIIKLYSSSFKLHIRLTDLNTVKSNFEKLEFEIRECESFDLADFIYDDYDNIVVACTKYDAFASISVYNVSYSNKFVQFINFFI